MKITAILLTVACLNVAAKGFSQNISFSGQNVPLDSVFSSVEKQTGFLFLYTESVIRLSKPVTIRAENVPLEKFLSDVFATQQLDFAIRGKSIFISPKTVAASADRPIPGNSPGVFKDTIIEASGKVTDEDGKPLAGATINVKSSKKFAVTDKAGRFILSTQLGETLVISFVGYTGKEHKITNAPSAQDINITLERSASVLKESVVTAIGIEKNAKELGYAVTKITSEEINRTSPSNLLIGLSGKVSGLSVATQSADMNPQMRTLLRGIRSISSGSNNLPLFVLNGSPMSFGSSQSAANIAMDFISNLNPNDIEDVTVLKGANGTALYGPEGVNGVILITTKKGNKGGKPAINFMSTVNFQKIDFRNIGLQTRYGPGNATNSLGDPIYDPTAMGGWGPAFNGEMVQLGRPDENGEIQKVPYQYTNERRRFFETGQHVQNMLSLSSGDARSDLYFGVTFSTQTGFLSGDKKNTGGLLLNTSRQVGKFNVRLLTQYTRYTMNQGAAIETLDFFPAHVPLSRYKDYKNDKWSDPNHYWSDNQENPYQSIDRIRSTTTNNALMSGLAVAFTPLPWLTVTNKLGVIYQGTAKKATIGPVYYADWARFNGSIRLIDADPALTEEVTNISSINNDFLIQTKHQKNDLVFRTTLGANIRENQFKEVKARSRALAVPVYNLAYSILPPVVTEVAELTRSVSYFGEVSAGYRDRAFLSIVARNDWDSKLASVARKKNWYYGANTSLILNQIFPVLGELKWLDHARLRAAVIKTANMNVAPYQSESTLQLSGDFPYNSVLGFELMARANPHLVPEKIISQEYGIGLSFLKERVLVDVTRYYQRNNGMLLRTQNSGYSGGPELDNIGKFANFGWEFDLSVSPVVKTAGNFSLDLAFRLSINDNKLLKLSDSYAGEMPGGGGEGFSSVVKEGSHAYAFKLFDWKRDDAGRVIVDRNTGMPSVDYNKPIIRGRSLPKYLGGISLAASWKKWRMNIVAEYNGGHDHYFSNGNQLLANGMHPLTTQNDRQPFVFPNSVYFDGAKYVENTNVPVRSAGRELYMLYAQATNHMLSSGAFWKIREIAFSYELALKKGFTRKIDLAVFGRDLFSFFPRSNILGDPQLVKGPGKGKEGGTIGSGPSRSTEPGRDNNSGAGSDLTRVPGTVLFGARVNITF